MGRWEPDASGRLRKAAMELYLERGFDQTTVAEIAERAGLTSRTFFRYFADKREVLFAGAEVLQAELVAAIECAPADTCAMAVVTAALDAAADLLGGRRDWSRQRYDVIAANPELRERELIKMAGLAAVVADGLRRRGVAEPDASLAAEAGIAVFRVAFTRWVHETTERDLTDVMHESLAHLAAVTSAPGGSAGQSAT